jgi:hypothetical protein
VFSIDLGSAPRGANAKAREAVPGTWARFKESTDEAVLAECRYATHWISRHQWLTVKRMRVQDAEHGAGATNWRCPMKFRGL